MNFNKQERNKLLDYVASNLMGSCDLSLHESKKMVRKSILSSKIESFPSFVAHCSMSQLVDLVKKDRRLNCF